MSVSDIRGYGDATRRAQVRSVLRRPLTHSSNVSESSIAPAINVFDMLTRLLEELPQYITLLCPTR